SGRVRLGRRRTKWTRGDAPRARRGAVDSGTALMTPLHFEHLYQDEWAELETLLNQLAGRRPDRRAMMPDGAAAKIAVLYRRACEHLALARARAYPAYMVDRLERLTSDAHQVIYQQRELGVARLRAFITHGFPRAVRDHRRYVAASTITFLLPTLLVALLVYRRPGLILSVVGADTVGSFGQSD